MIQRKVATITLNPAYDLIGSVPEMVKGAVNQVTTRGLHAAGKGINVARVLRDLGLDVSVGGLLGEENRQGFTELFGQLAITDHCQSLRGRTRINVKITEADAEVTELNFSGFQVSEADWQNFYQDSLTWLCGFDMVCVSGSLPQGIAYPAFSQWLTDIRQGCPCLVLDSSGEALVAGIAAQPWLIKPNRHELEVLVGRPLTTPEQVLNAAYQLHGQGITHVVVSLGSAGAIWVSNEGSWQAKPPACEIVSTVGAGDSMVAGLIYGLLMGESTAQTLRLATAVSAMAVSQTGVGVSCRAQLAALMEAVELQAVATAQTH